MSEEPQSRPPPASYTGSDGWSDVIRTSRIGRRHRWSCSSTPHFRRHLRYRRRAVRVVAGRVHLRDVRGLLGGNQLSWVASAYGTKDWIYRLIVMLQMVCVIILARGLPWFYSTIEQGGYIQNGVFLGRHVVMRIWSAGYRCAAKAVRSLHGI